MAILVLRSIRQHARRYSLALWLYGRSDNVMILEACCWGAHVLQIWSDCIFIILCIAYGWFHKIFSSHMVCRLSQLLCGYSTRRQCTIFLAVNRIGAFCTQAGNRPHNRGYHLPAWLNRKNICLIILKSWVRVPLETEFFHMLVPTSACAVGAELSHLGFCWEGNSNTLVPAQPMSSATVILITCSRSVFVPS